MHNLALMQASKSFDDFVRFSYAQPMVSLDEEQALIKSFRSTGCLESAQRLVFSHLRAVVSQARKLSGYGLPREDLVQEGVIGLMKAVKRFDPDRGVRLISFAMHWISAEMHEYILRNWRIVKMATSKPKRKLFFNLRSMKLGDGPISPTEAARIASDLDVKVSEVIEMDAGFLSPDVAADPVGLDEGEVSPLSMLEDAGANPEYLLDRQEHEHRVAILTQALIELNDRDRDIIQSRWLRDGEEKSTLKDLSEKYGVSMERIRQIEVRAIEKLKHLMVP